MTLEQAEAAMQYELHKDGKIYMFKYYDLQEKHEEQRKQETAAEAAREAKHGKRNRLSQWWYNRCIARRDERWWQEEQELLEIANPLQAMMRYKEHYEV